MELKCSIQVASTRYAVAGDDQYRDRNRTVVLVHVSNEQFV